MSRSSAVRIIFIAMLCVGLAVIVHAQTISGTILGTVTDESKAALPGVTITMKNIDTGATRTIVTDPNGHYHSPGLSLGRYEIKAELEGFQTNLRTGVTLVVGQQAVVDFAMKLAKMSEVVVVQAEAPLVNTTESSVSFVVDEKKIKDLPLNGRDYGQLILLQPGVTLSRASQNSSDTGRGIKLSVAGSRPNQNLFTLDGTDYNDALNNTPGSAQGYMTGVETIKEFQVLTNTMSAEYGRAAGGVFNVVTKSGTNELHGSAFEFHRDKNLNARNFFDPNIPDFRRNQFGGSIGGPIMRDRTFFFGSYEGLREVKDVPLVAIVPDENARKGILPGSTKTITIPATIQPYLNLFPHANGPSLGAGVAEYDSQFNRKSMQNFALLRVDQNFSERDSAFARYLYDNSSVDQPISYPEWPNIVRNKKSVGTLEYRHMFSAATLNEARFGINKSKPVEDVNPLEPHSDMAFVPGKVFGSINVTGLTEIGTDRTNPKVFAADIYQLNDAVTFVSSRNNIKTGFNLEHFKYDGNSESRSRGRLSFRNLSDFLNGKPRQFEVAKAGSDFQRNYNQNLVGLFVQDDIDVTQRFVLNAGVRWEFVTTPKEENGKVSNLRNFTDPTVTVGDPLYKNPTKKNFAPRLGFVWNLTGDGRTALRGGYGIFHEQPLFYQFRNPIFRTTPFVDRATVSNPTLPIDFTKATAGGVPDIESFVYNLHSSYTTHYNINIQRDLGFFNTYAFLGYLGSRGHNLLGQGDVNIAIPQIQADGTEFFPAGSKRRNAKFGSIRAIMEGFRSKYDGINFALQQRRTAGFQYQVSYTYGKAYDNRSGTSGRQEYSNGQARTFDPYDFDKDWGPSDFDVRHNLIMNASYDLPGRGRVLGGWQINMIGTYASGVPFSPIIPGDPDRDGSTDNVARPNLVTGCDPNKVPSGRSVNMWFNPQCFAFPALGTRGNAGRNILRGPDMRTVDMSLVKTTALAAGYSAQLRFEVFNLFNRANWDLPANSTDGEAIFDETGNRLADAGKITSTATDARSFQLALRLTF